MTKYWFVLIALLLLVGFCFYAAIFYGWAATATASNVIHEQARQLANWWSAGIFLCLVFAGIAVWRMIRLFRRSQRTK
jgi:hypothetical protein